MEKEYKKYFPKVPSPNQRILLSGPSESLKDVRSDDEPTSSSGADIVGTSNKNTFREGDRVEYIGDHSLMSTTSAYGYRGKVMLAFETNGSSKVGVRFDNPIPNGNDLGGLCEINHDFFCHAVELQPDSSSGEEVDILALGKLIEVLSEESKNSNLIVLLKDVEKSFTKCTESHAPLSKLPPDAESHNDQEAIKSKAEKSRTATESTMHLNNLFPNKILIELPQNEAQQSDLKKQLEHDTETFKVKANISNFRKILTSNEIECNDLEELSINDHLLTNENVDKIVRYAVSHHLRHIKHAKGAKMVLPIESLKLAFSVVWSTHSENKTSKSALKDVITENKFEEKVLSNIISPNDSGVPFVDIGALGSMKETLKELVVLPLQRPELFNEVKPVKGILLFGPPGTGKTILAKAVAKEAGAKFINMSIFITSKWLGEIEKYVDAIFSLASKLSPAVIFVDEIDRLLGNREKPGEHEAMRRMKNEFMVNWDVFRSKEQEHVIILGATNRPFDLDDDVIQRFPHRLMVSLPDASNRENILRVILSKLRLGPDVDIQSVANMTKGYLLRDLNNLCFAAVRRPFREIVEKENKEKSLAIAEGRPEPPLYGVKDVRPLGMDDLKFSLGQVRASFSPDSTIMNQLVKWNDEFGDGGSRKKETLGYFM
ncbi:hypothetical protein U9M48_036927 [Paspalum notatum var. saurae]|uniref:AAA+ ATPase domain-containing protein n=1 Tax=Paspalum notatum var. saurae TaxID=547442 RepID=A0AAQ3X9F6_PASNO